MQETSIQRFEAPEKFSSLGPLAQASSFHAPVELLDHQSRLLLKNLKMMLLIRKAEEKIGSMVAANKIACPCHLAIGQEAVAVGVSNSLRKSDRIFGAHRSHAHYLAAGGSLRALFAEVLGKITGCSKGMGGSMHLTSISNGFLGSVPIVAGTVPIAVGAGLAAQKDGKGDIAVSYLGDGAMEEGCVHESLNFAATFKLPVLFVCENNLFSSHLHIDLRQPNDSVARFAKAHQISSLVIDGNDLPLLTSAAESLIEKMRRGGGPAFIEAVTYRWRGHVGPREDIDVGVRRNVELELWKKRDPIARLAQALIQKNLMTSDEFENLKGEIDFQIESEWKSAEQDDYPPVENLMDTVYATTPNIAKK